MAHSYSHTPSHLSEDNNVHRLLYAFGVTAGFILVEVIGGFLSGSLASPVDVGYMLADTATLLFALLAVQFSRQPPTIYHTFGRLRLTTLAASVSIITLVVITILIVWEMVERFYIPCPAEGGMMMVIAVVGLSANILSFWLPRHGSEEKSLNVRAAALHVLEDLLDSVRAIIAALIIIWTGWTSAGPILSILVLFLVLCSAWRLLRDSVNEPLEGASVSLDIAELKRHSCREIPEVCSVHHTHVWMAGEELVMTLHVQVIPPYDHDALLDQIQHYLMDHYQIEHAIIQTEYQPCHEPDRHLNEGMSDHSYHHH